MCLSERAELLLPTHSPAAGPGQRCRAAEEVAEALGGCRIQGREERGVQGYSADGSLSLQGRAAPPGSSHLLQNELAAGFPALRPPGEFPPSPCTLGKPQGFVGRAGPGRAPAFTSSPFS